MKEYLEVLIFHELRCSVPVYVTYTVNDTVTPSVKPIGLDVYVDCVDVRAESNTLFLDFDLPEYMNAPVVNEFRSASVTMHNHDGLIRSVSS